MWANETKLSLSVNPLCFQQILTQAKSLGLMLVKDSENNIKKEAKNRRVDIRTNQENP